MTEISDSKTRAATLAGFAEWHQRNSRRFVLDGKQQAPSYVLPGSWLRCQRRTRSPTSEETRPIPRTETSSKRGGPLRVP